MLLAIPVLVGSGVLEATREVYDTLGPAFYGLRTVMLTLLFMGLLRFRRPEGLKEASPPQLGRLPGLDRICEVKTLRRKLGMLAEQEKVDAFAAKLAKRRLAKREGMLGFLYVDGHARVYNGKHKLAKAYVTQRLLSMPTTTDYWMNDQQGSPVFVVTAPANEGLSKMLTPVLDELRKLIGDTRRLTIVFVRGGYCLKLFRAIMEKGFDLVTYRKGKVEPVPEELFFDDAGNAWRRLRSSTASRR